MIKKEKLEREISRILFLQKAGGDHSSGRKIAQSLVRPTRELEERATHALPYLVLLRAGFAELLMSPSVLVGSYPTFSPLPSDL